jgi:hypothetical protein
MPFASQKQRAFMYSRHPEIAKRWRRESGPQRGLPEHSAGSKPSRKGTRRRLIEQFIAKRGK